MLDAGIVDRTVWITLVDGEWVAVRLNGEVIARDRYQENVAREACQLASVPANRIHAVAIVRKPVKRKPTTNKPPVVHRPR